MSEKYKVKLGWTPRPVHPKTKYANSILPTVHKEYFPVCQRPDKFKEFFLQERNRQFDLKTKAEKLSSQVEFVRGNNPAAAGRFLAENFVAKGKQDRSTIERNIKKLKDKQEEAAKLQDELEKHDNSLFKPGGRFLLRGRGQSHASNALQLENIRTLQRSISSALEKLEGALQKVLRLYPYQETAKQSRKDKVQRRKKVKRRENRKEQGAKEILDAIAPNRKGGPVTPANIDTAAVKGLSHRLFVRIFNALEHEQMTTEGKDKILKNLSSTCRRLVNQLASKGPLHADCIGYCEADEECPVNWECAHLLAELELGPGALAQTHRFAPWETGQAQVGLQDLNMDVLKKCTDAKTLQILDDNGCFDMEASEVVCAKLAQLEGECDCESD
ncbi:uncharacterized protein LOC118404669 [Branchiostoma floridae]|uniref:Uncharacterized protein LOC118404669 n=1 Tax=Branchiostoma floridae TaxID=7739 RepID=A0A9J7KHX4_BRAFL|nr:uncharacterized protein LOC118404669 [Branchiostoma floridae]